MNTNHRSAFLVEHGTLQKILGVRHVYPCVRKEQCNIRKDGIYYSFDIGWFCFEGCLGSRYNIVHYPWLKCSPQRSHCNNRGFSPFKSLEHCFFIHVLDFIKGSNPHSKPKLTLYSTVSVSVFSARH